MKKNLLARNAGLALALTLAAVPAFAKPPANDIRLTVLLYDYVNLPADARVEAVTSAKRVLGTAGITADFIECYSGGLETGRPECTGPLEPGVVMLRVFRPKLAQYGKQLGYAAMTEEGGASVTLFIDPSRRRARIEALSDAVLLGHGVAHEIGHLLLGANSHSSGGIMRPAWRLCDEEWMAKGALQFSSGEAKKMQATLLARLGR